MRYVCRCIACFTLIDSLRKLRLSVRRVSYSSQFVACVMFVGASRLLIVFVDRVCCVCWLRRVGWLVWLVALPWLVALCLLVVLRCVALRCVALVGSLHYNVD